MIVLALFLASNVRKSIRLSGNSEIHGEEIYTFRGCDILSSSANLRGMSSVQILT